MDTQNSHQMLDNTRRMASEAMDRAETSLRDLRHSMQGMASRGMSSMSESALAARDHLGYYARSGGRYVAEHPMKSALIAAAVGAAVAGIVMVLRSRSHDDL